MGWLLKDVGVTEVCMELVLGYVELFTWGQARFRSQL